MLGRILVACEFSGVVRDAFIKRGFDAVSCDLLPTESPGPHYCGDIRDILNDGWDLMIAHPPCTYLTVSAEWAYKDPADISKRLSPDKLYGQARKNAREKAAAFFMSLTMSNIPRYAIENPVGVMSTRWRKPDQIIQPYEYGHNASKRTCLWLKGLDKLTPTQYVYPRIIRGLNRWDNQTDSGQNRLPPSANRGHIRSVFYTGWAKAMAKQWGRTL